MIESYGNHWSVDRHPTKVLPQICVQGGDVTESTQNLGGSSLKAEAIEQVVRAVSATRTDDRLCVLLGDCGFQCATTRLRRSGKKALFRENLVAIELRRIAKPRQLVASAFHALLCDRTRERENADRVARSQRARLQRLGHVSQSRIRNFQRRVQKRGAKRLHKSSSARRDVEVYAVRAI